MKIRRKGSLILSFIFTFFLVANCGNIAAKADVAPVFNVTASNIDGENYNHVEWTDLGKGYSYRVYQKGQADSIYQSIPTKKSVKTLNIYPDVNLNSAIPNTGLSNGQIDLDGKAVPDSGILKTWLLKESISDVTIDCVSLSSFNANPSKYLKKVDGNWNYDSVFYGIWNLSPGSPYPNDGTVEYLRNFINEGGGFMTSHHTIGYVDLDRGINKLAKEMGVEIFSTQPYSKDPRYCGTDSNGKLFNTVSFEELSEASPDTSPYWVWGDKVKITKNGLLINYPFKVGKVGDIISIPVTHGMGMLCKGDVWMNVNNPDSCGGGTFREVTKSPATGASGTNNYYVHTYKNTAIVNSGHSFPKITTEETRIIANTLYYLSQITDKTTCEDHKGQDVTAPTKPNIKNVSVDKNTKKINISLDKSTDKGTSYSYYVEAKEGVTGNTIKSDTKSATVTSGLKGYSIVVDNKEDTVPSSNITTTSTEYSMDNKMGNNFYIHVAAVDNNDNVSDVSTYKYSRPTLELTASTTAEVKDKVTIKAETSSAKEIAKIITPDGKEVKGGTANYDVYENGTYTFKAVDVDGNEVSASIKIGNIKPDVILNVDPNKKKVRLDENITVDLNIDHITKVGAIDVIVKYDTSKLKFLGVTQVPGIIYYAYPVKEGEYRMTFATSPAALINSKQSLLKLNFTSIGAGKAEINVAKGRISNGSTNILREAECGETYINIIGTRLKEMTLDDIFNISQHVGEDPDALLPAIDADINLDGKIDKDDIDMAYKLMLQNPKENM